MLTNWEDIYRKVYNDYLRDDVELCGDFFDFEVSATKSELLKAYSELQKTINADTIVRLKNAIESPSHCGNSVFVSGFELLDPDRSMLEVYTGNMREFLETFNGQETTTGWYHLSEYDTNLICTGACGGIKRNFVL